MLTFSNWILPRIEFSMLSCGRVLFIISPILGWGGSKKEADLTRELSSSRLTRMNDCLQPVMQYWVGSSRHGDPTNYWTPNARCLKGMLHDLDCWRVETKLHDLHGGRLITHAWR